MKIQGFALFNNGTVLESWIGIPDRIALPPGGVIFNAVDGWTDGVYSVSPYSWDVPDPILERRLIQKSAILDRLTDDQLSMAISLMTDRQKERWRMPGHPWVYVDDTELLGLLSAIGADATVVLA